jgi:hypothetical protein
LEEVVEQCGDHCERQVPVRDGGAERSGCGSLGVDMDPLVVAGRVGKLVDLVLADLVPRARPELGTFEVW